MEQTSAYDQIFLKDNQRGVVEMLSNNLKGLKDGFASGDIDAALRNFDEKHLEYGSYLSGLYIASEYLVDSKYYGYAIPRLEECLSLCIEESNSWYIDSARLLLAYAFVMTGKIKEAKKLYSDIDNEISITWLYQHPTIDKDLIKQQIGNA